MIKPHRILDTWCKKVTISYIDGVIVISSVSRVFALPRWRQIRPIICSLISIGMLTKHLSAIITWLVRHLQRSCVHPSRSYVVHVCQSIEGLLAAQAFNSWPECLTWWKYRTSNYLRLVKWLRAIRGQMILMTPYRATPSHPTQWQSNINLINV